MHCVLIDKWWGELARTVNYRTEGSKLIERLPVSYDMAPYSRQPHWKTIYVPDVPNDKAWLIKPK